MICPSCQHENRPSAKFCGKCRARLQRVCPECGTEAVAGNAFCDECGAELAPAATSSAPPGSSTLEAEFTAFQQGLPPSIRDQLLTRAEGENRLVTVLFADMSRSVQT